MTWDELDELPLDGENEGEACPHCGAPLELDLFEVWPAERAFQLDSCCEGRQEDLLEDLQDGLRLPPAERRAYLEPLRQLLQAYGVPCRQVFGSWTTGTVRVDFGLEVREVAQAEARAFITEHHRHNRAPAGWRWGFGVFNGHELVAVAWVGRPVARGFDPARAVEVNRVCVDPTLDPELVWNACSMAYGAAAREAKRRGFARILTYTLEHEAGTTLKAAGWVPMDSKLEPVPADDERARVRGKSWSTPSRPRQDTAPTCDKIRWGRVLAA